MSKDTFYFSHDYNSRADDKIKGLIRKHGMTGYGVFWAIVEDLYNNANALHTDYEGIAYDLRVDAEMVKSIINDFDLFCFENGSFGSSSIEKRLDERNNKSEKARESAFKRWNKIKSDAKAMQSHSEGNAIKERKGKEIKENKIAFSIFWDLYNHKVGNKPGAEKKWNKLFIEEQQKIIEVLPSYLSTIKDKQFQAHAETWLNQRRWENEDLQKEIRPVKAIEKVYRDGDLIPNPDHVEPQRTRND
jgi:hypothetical protein